MIATNFMPHPYHLSIQMKKKVQILKKQKNVQVTFCLHAYEHATVYILVSRK